MDTNTTLNEGMIHSCGCSQCASDQGVSTNIALNTQSQSANSQETSVTAPSGNLDPTSNADEILTGYAHGAGDGSAITITYSFHGGYQSYWSQDSGFQYNTSGMSGFSTAQENATRDILDEISSFTNITFQEVSGSTNPDIGFINAQASDGSTSLGGSAYYPTGWDGAGDVFINTLFWGYDGTGGDAGDVNYYILLHEIGHALGLEHTFSAGLTGAENTEQYSVMAYDSSPYGSTYAGSYMLYDIYSLQQLYGVNYAYNSGNTVYTLDPNAAYTIWDGGGIDTLDGSAQSAGMTITLDDGTFSSVGMTENIAIAYDAIIENAIGGSGGDTIYGNSVSNDIDGRNGGDTIYASAGDDNLDGGQGNDTVIYGSALSNFTFNFINSTTIEVTDTTGTYGTDLLYNFETFTFNGVNYDYAGLETNGLSSNIEPIRMRVFWAGGKDNVWSSESGTNTYTAATLGFDGVSGNLLQTTRSGSDLTLTFLQDVPFQNLRIDGSDSRDVITISGSISDVDALIYAGGGNDSITINSGVAVTHTVFGGSGDDTLQGSVNNDELYGDADNDTLYGNGGADRLYGGEGQDTLNGGQDADRLYGENGNDTINGDDGWDRLYGQAGNDTLNGGSGDDYLYAHTGEDILNGDAGRDRLYGMEDNDTLNGGADRDHLYGGSGDDLLIGGTGTDFLYGESGQDTFGFTSLDGSIDRVQDFTLSGSNRDALNITDLLSGYNIATDDINDFVNIHYKGSNVTHLKINADGVGNDWVTVAYLKGSDLTGINASDLLASNQLIVDQTLL